MYSSEATIYFTALIAGLLLSALIIYLVLTLIGLQRGHQAYRQQKVQAEISELEARRYQLAAHFHDDMGPVIFAARNNFAAIEIKDPTGLARKKEGLMHLDRLTDMVRNLSVDLHPAGLEIYGLAPALESFFNSIRSNGVDLSFLVREVPEFSKSNMVHIYRIIQEIMFNALRHSKATMISVEMYAENNHFIISTADNGTGFNYAERLKERGQGLKDIINRADLLQADLKVNTDHGTCYFISIPYALL